MALPLRTDHLVSCLLGYVGSAENAVTRVSKTHPVLSAVGLQRCVLGFSAEGERHLPVVVGPEGSGKTFLLTAVAQSVREAFPLLPVHASFRAPGSNGRARAVAFLRELAHVQGGAGDLDTLTPNEVLHNGPSLLRRLGARAAGLVLLVDDLLDVCSGDLPCWLPLPLPPGLHCVATVRGSAAADAAAVGARLGISDASSIVIRRLSPLGPPEQGAVPWRPAAPPEVAAAALSQVAAAGCDMTPRVCRLLVHLVALEPAEWRARLREAALMLHDTESSQPLPSFLVEERSEPLTAAQTSVNAVEENWDAQGALALAILQACGRKCGPGAKDTFAYLACASHGLCLAEIVALRQGASYGAAATDAGPAGSPPGFHAALELELCAPLLQDPAPGAAAKGQAQSCARGESSQRLYSLGGDFAVRACTAFCSAGPVTVGAARCRLASLFAAAPAAGAGGAERALEAAAAQLAEMDLQAEGAGCVYSAFITRRSVLEHFATRPGPDELIRLWRRAESGCAGVGERLLLQSQGAGWPPEATALAGRLLSLAGEFAAARALLQRAAEGFASQHGGERGRAEALVLLAHNEVRYWDSRRDWRGVPPLRLLLDSSAEAIAIFRQRPMAGPSDRHWLARALSRRANGCFKAGCVLEPGSAEQDRYFDEADSFVVEAVALLKGTHMQILGESILVGGVTTLCRSHSLRRTEHPYVEVALRAMTQFYHAEAILRLSVGPMNEMSIYTHGNLAELFLQDLGEPLLGLLHCRHSAVVAARVFGPQHHNAARKLQELEQLFLQLGWHRCRELVRAGRPEAVSPREVADRLQAMSVQLCSPNVLQVAAALRGMSTSPPSSDHVGRHFWGPLWRDLGLPEEIMASINFPM